MNSKGSEKIRKFQTEGGVNNFGIWRAWEVEHFGISEGKGGGVKMFMPSVEGYGYFLESLIQKQISASLPKV